MIIIIIIIIKAVITMKIVIMIRPSLITNCLVKNLKCGKTLREKCVHFRRVSTH